MNGLVDAERILLASWIMGDNRELLDEFETFPVHTQIFQAVKESEPQDTIAIARKAGKRVNEIAELIAEYSPYTFNSAYKAMKQAKVMHMISMVTVDNLSEQLSKIADELSSMDITNIRQASNPIAEYRAELERRTKYEPLRYGIERLDYITGGIRRKELTIIAARPSVGKTALALQVAYNMAIKQHKVLFFPLEMSSDQLMERIACRETKVKHEHLKYPKQMTQEEKEELDHFLKQYEYLMMNDLIIVEGANKLTEIRKQIEHHRPEIVFIDQLSQLRDGRAFKSIREQFTYMTNTLKAWTMELDIPIILLAQINRDAQNNEPNLANLKESGSLEEDGDNVIMIHQTGEPTFDMTPMDIIVRKQRNGARDVVVHCQYANKKFTFWQEARLK